MTGKTAIRGARVLALEGGAGLRRGAEMRALGAIDQADVVWDESGIVAVGVGVADGADRVIEADGRVCMPAFVDCHTHACWAGDRLDEWAAKLAGASYLELLERGGGIMSTVRAVRASTAEQLSADLLLRLRRMLRAGTATIEVKSGYGLSTADELKMLRAITIAARSFEGTVVPTACIGHAFDPEVDVDVFVDRTIEETLPAVSEAFPGIAIDGYCEQGAWSLEQTMRLLARAVELGHPVRIHADQFTELGMVQAAVEVGARSVDHLEATGADGLRSLAGSASAGVVLPCSGLHLDQRYADARTLLDHGGGVAVATNINPGSAPCGDMAMAVALSARFCGLLPDEAVVAATANGAAVLGLDDRGRLEPGCRADLILLSHRDERQLAFEFGLAAVDLVVCGGRMISGLGAG